eukprot:GHRR01005220.1.p2 GENE.GHRR01005220.1~~GHRR01005220.1.p2  ORF type:complete len:132 (-),score=6.96 GHRR01005220.1:244-639(-)
MLQVSENNCMLIYRKHCFILLAMSRGLACITQAYLLNKWSCAAQPTCFDACPAIKHWACVAIFISRASQTPLYASLNPTTSCMSGSNLPTGTHFVIQGMQTIKVGLLIMNLRMSAYIGTAFVVSVWLAFQN